MATNAESLRAFRRREKARNEDAPYKEKWTECVCPRCGKLHQQRMNWIGRGTPRVRCGECDLYLYSLQYDFSFVEPYRVGL